MLEIMQKFQFIYIDAPLTLPHGRNSLEVRNEHHFRECDLLLRKRGIKFFSHYPWSDEDAYSAGYAA
jgi:predicted nuclease with RNAse H fold